MKRLFLHLDLVQNTREQFGSRVGRVDYPRSGSTSIGHRHKSVSSEIKVANMAESEEVRYGIMTHSPGITFSYN